MTTTLGTIRLTRAEWEIIEHRLCCSDCLAEVLADTFDWKYATCEPVIYNLWRRLEKEFKASPAVEVTLGDLNPIEVEALRDCVDGSTFFASSSDAVASGEITQTRLMTWLKLAYGIEAKFKAAGLETTGFPQH